jgi:hypothetical protein
LKYDKKQVQKRTGENIFKKRKKKKKQEETIRDKTGQFGN